VVNSKPELLGCAAQWNPFGSQTFAWVDAGVAREGKIDNGFPGGSRPIVLPSCSPWSLCVGRRMWLVFDFRSKLKLYEARVVNTLTDEHLERILCPSGKLAFAELATGNYPSHRKYSGGTDDRVQTAAAFVTLLRELGEDNSDESEVVAVRTGLTHYMSCFEARQS
ncbi:unnamed protein product, partial [Effrenium voratum]